MEYQSFYRVESESQGRFIVGIGEQPLCDITSKQADQRVFKHGLKALLRFLFLVFQQKQLFLNQTAFRFADIFIGIVQHISRA